MLGCRQAGRVSGRRDRRRKRERYLGVLLRGLQVVLKFGDIFLEQLSMKILFRRQIGGGTDLREVAFELLQIKGQNPCERS